MDPNTALAALRAMVTRFNDHATYEDMDELVETVQGLDEWLSKGGFLPAGWAASNRVGPNDLHALSEITDACIHGYKVARLMPGSDNVIEGVARSIGDERGNFLRRDEDVRDGFLRVSGLFEYFWPIRELMPQVHESTFVVQRGK